MTRGARLVKGGSESDDDVDAHAHAGQREASEIRADARQRVLRLVLVVGLGRLRLSITAQRVARFLDELAATNGLPRIGRMKALAAWS